MVFLSAPSPVTLLLFHGPNQKNLTPYFVTSRTLAQCERSRIYEILSNRANFNENPSMRAIAKILRARASEHSSKFCEQIEQRPNFASTRKILMTIRYPSLSRGTKRLVSVHICSVEGNLAGIFVSKVSPGSFVIKGRCSFLSFEFSADHIRTDQIVLARTNIP